MIFDYDTIAQAVSGRLLAPGARATGLAWDSRTIAAGDVYVALPGERVDGHDFCLSALESGASGVLVSRELPAEVMQTARDCGAGVVLVDDCLDAVARLARVWRPLLQGQVVAITGSSGKTSTKSLVRDVLSAHGSVCATLANQNNELGVPATLLRADADTQSVVVEMGMRGLGEISSLCDIVRPNMALVTNVGTSHMELLGSQEQIARAKAEVFQGLGQDSWAFLNASDAHVRDLLRFGGLDRDRAATTLVFFDGSGNDPESYERDIRPSVYARDIVLDGAGHPQFVLCTPRGDAPCRLQLQGRHNVHNACAAAAVGCAVGMEPAAIASALELSQPQPGRQQVLESSGGFTVLNDAYNANPDSMCAALDMFGSLEVAGRRIAVLGDMGELGDYALPGHERVGRAAAGSNLDALVCVGELAGGIASAAIEEGMDRTAVQRVRDAAEALERLAGTLESGDHVLVKASHAMGLDAVAFGLVDQ